MRLIGRDRVNGSLKEKESFMKQAGKIKDYFKNFKFTADFALKCLAYLVLIAYVVLMAGGKKFFSPTSVFWRSLNIFSKAGVFNPAIRIASYIVFLLGASWVLRFVLKKLATPLHRGKAIVDIICSLIKYAAISIKFCASFWWQYDCVIEYLMCQVPFFL